MDKKNINNYISEETISDEEFKIISKIVEIRINSKISQKELQEKTGISQPNITRFEKNTHNATLSTTLKILNALGYTLEIVKK